MGCLKNLRNCTLGLAGSLLLGLYGWVSYLVLNPRVSDYYRAYYIEKSTTLTRKMLDRLKDYPPGTYVDHNENTLLLFDGWSEPEEKWRWSNGKDASLVFRLAPGQCLQGVLHLDANYIRGQRVSVVINGNVVDQFVAEAGRHERRITFDPGVVNCGGMNRVSFLLPDAAVASPRDPRLLGLALYRVAIE